MLMRFALEILADHATASELVGAQQRSGEDCESVPPSPKRLQFRTAPSNVPNAEPGLLAKATTLDGYAPGEIVIAWTDARGGGCGPCEVMAVSFSVLAAMLESVSERALSGRARRVRRVFVVHNSKPPKQSDLSRIGLMTIMEAVRRERLKMSDVIEIRNRATPIPSHHIFTTDTSFAKQFAAEVIDWHQVNDPEGRKPKTKMQQAVLDFAQDILADRVDGGGSGGSQDFDWDY